MTPVAHTIVGVWLGDILTEEIDLRHIIFFTLISSLPDFDMFVQIFMPEKIIHQLYTHNILFVLIATFFVFIVSKNLNLTKFTFLILLIHLFLDIFVEDFREPYGVPVFWPITSYTLNFPIFPTFHKESFEAVFSFKNLKTLLIEAFLFSPFLYFLIDDYRKRER